MKTLLALLLVSVGIGAAYWKTQRPGEGVDALRADALSVVERLRDGSDAVRNGGSGASAEQVAEQANAIADTQADVDKARTAVNDLNSELSSRIDALEAKLSNADTEIASLSSSSASPDTLDEALQKIDALEGQLDLMSRRIEESNPDDQLAEITERMDGMSSAIDELTSRTTSDADQTAETVATLEERLSTVDTRISSLAAGGSAGSDGQAASGQGLDAAADQRIAALESKVDSARATSLRMQALTNRFNTVDNRLESTAATTAELQTAVERLESLIAQTATQTDALSIDTVQQEIREQLAALDASVAETAGADVSALTDSLDATRERIQALESRVQDLPASSSEADDAQQNQSALESQIAALERRLETLPTAGADSALADSLTEVRQQVDQLSTQDFVTQEELRQQVQGKNVEYKIYFDKNSTELSADAAAVLDSFIAQETNRTTGVDIFGFTDRAGPASYNQQLAQRRASAVRSYLLQNGFDFTKIDNVAGLGEDAAAALLEDDQEDAQQRVVVLFAAQL